MSRHMLTCSYCGDVVRNAWEQSHCCDPAAFDPEDDDIVRGD